MDPALATRDVVRDADEKDCGHISGLLREELGSSSGPDGIWLASLEQVIGL